MKSVTPSRSRILALRHHVKDLIERNPAVNAENMRAEMRSLVRVLRLGTPASAGTVSADEAATGRRGTDSDLEKWPTAGLVLNRRGDILACNQAARNLLNTSQALRGQNFLRFIDPVEQARFDAFLKSAFEDHTRHTCDVRLGGSGRNTGLMRIEGRLDPEKNRLYCALVDLRRPQRVGSDIAIQRDNLRTVLDNMPVGVFIVGEAHKIQYINPILKADFGPVENRTCYAYLHDRTTPCSHCKIQEVSLGHTFYREWYSARTRKTYDVIETPFMAADGVCYKVDILRNITSQKQTEDALKWELRVNSILSKLYEPLISPQASLDQIADIILEFSRQLTGSPHGFVSTIDPQNGDCVGHTLSAMHRQECRIRPTEPIRFPRRPDGSYPSLWGHCLNTRKPFVTNDAPGYPDSCELPPGHLPIDRFLSVPVLLGQELVGQIALANKPRDYGKRDLEAVIRIARYYALAIKSKRTADKVKRANEELEARVRARTTELATANAELRCQIEERHQAEKALRESEEKYSTLVEDSLIGVYIVQDGIICFANQKIADIHGYRKEELIGMESLELIHPADRERVLEIREKRLKGDPVPSEYETKGITKDGKTIWVLRRNTLVNYQGRPAISSNVNDITQRKKVESALRESDVELRLLSNQLLSAEENERKRIARELHDSIGQSLSAIKFTIENALQTVPKNTDTSHMRAMASLVPLIQETIEDVRRIVMDLRPSLLDDLGVLATISWVCREFQTLYRSIQIRTHLAVEETDIPQSLKTVVYRVLQEALNNVAKHSGADRVDLRLRKNLDRIEMTISDNGRGFAVKETLSRVSLQGGFGLLSMRERVAMAGANFSIDSSPGRGARIRMTWPRSRVAGKSGNPDDLTM